MKRGIPAGPERCFLFILKRNWFDWKIMQTYFTQEFVTFLSLLHLHCGGGGDASDICSLPLTCVFSLPAEPSITINPKVLCRTTLSRCRIEMQLQGLLEAMQYSNWTLRNL